MAYSEKEKEKIFNDICEDVVNNKMSFNKAIDKSNITFNTFYVWLRDNESFQKKYNYARDMRSDVLFEEIIEIADTTENGVKIKDTPKGLITETGDMTDHRRLKIDARKWVVARMNPKKYGNTPDDSRQDDNEIIIKIVE